MMIIRIISFFIAFSLQANTEEFFLQANAAYHNHDYEKALNLYEKIEPKSVAVFYNMGNCWFHLGNYLQSCICWKKAEKRGHSAQLLKTIEYNYLQAAQKLNVEHDCHYELQKYGKRFIQSYSLGLWQFLFLSSWYILLIGFYLLYRSRKKIWVVFLVLPNLMIGSGLTLKFFLTTEKSAIVNQNTVLFAGTDKHFNSRGKIVTGQEVVIDQTSGDWCKVHSNKQSGWVKADTLEYVSC